MGKGTESNVWREQGTSFQEHNLEETRPSSPLGIAEDTLIYPTMVWNARKVLPTRETQLSLNMQSWNRGLVVEGFSAWVTDLCDSSSRPLEKKADVYHKSHC